MNSNKQRYTAVAIVLHWATAGFCGQLRAV